MGRWLNDSSIITHFFQTGTQMLSLTKSECKIDPSNKWKKKYGPQFRSDLKSCTPQVLYRYKKWLYLKGVTCSKPSFGYPCYQGVSKRKDPWRLKAGSLIFVWVLLTTLNMFEVSPKALGIGTCDVQPELAGYKCLSLWRWWRSWPAQPLCGKDVHKYKSSSSLSSSQHFRCLISYQSPPSMLMPHEVFLSCAAMFLPFLGQLKISTHIHCCSVWEGPEAYHSSPCFYVRCSFHGQTLGTRYTFPKTTAIEARTFHKAQREVVFF